MQLSGSVKLRCADGFGVASGVVEPGRRGNSPGAPPPGGGQSSEGGANSSACRGALSPLWCEVAVACLGPYDRGPCPPSRRSVRASSPRAGASPRPPVPASPREYAAQAMLAPLQLIGQVFVSTTYSIALIVLRIARIGAREQLLDLPHQPALLLCTSACNSSPCACSRWRAPSSRQSPRDRASPASPHDTVSGTSANSRAKCSR